MRYPQGLNVKPIRCPLQPESKNTTAILAIIRERKVFMISSSQKPEMENPFSGPHFVVAQG
jgi:hypothetical protein